jgi:hypothetical protein
MFSVYKAAAHDSWSTNSSKPYYQILRVYDYNSVCLDQVYR